MKELTAKNGDVATMERVYDAFDKLSYGTCYEAVEAYFTNAKLFCEELDIANAATSLMDIAAICAVQEPIMRIVRATLCDLLGIKETDTRTKQKEGNQFE